MLERYVSTNVGIYIAMIEQFTKGEFIEGDPAKPE